MKLITIYTILFFASQYLVAQNQEPYIIQDSIDIEFSRAFNNVISLSPKDSIIPSSLSLLKNYVDKRQKNTRTREIVILIKHCQKQNNDACLRASYFLLGRQFFKKKEYLKSLMAYNKVEELGPGNDSIPDNWSFYMHKGYLINELQEHRLARKYFKNSLQYLKPNQDYRKGVSYLNISATFDLEHYDSSAYYGKKAYAVFKERPTSTGLFYASVNNIAYSYIKQGQLKKARDIITENIDIEKLDPKKTTRAFESYFFNTMGELHYRLKNYDSAIYFYQKSIYSPKDVYSSSHLFSLNDLAEIYELKENYQEALKYRKAKEDFLKQFDKDKLNKEVAKIEYFKTINEKNQLISSLEKKNQSSSEEILNTKMIATSIGLFSIISLLVFLAIYQKSRLKISQLNEEMSLTRLKSLKSMMNPHFLFNSFNTLQGFILHKDKFEASTHMRELSQLIRKILSNSESLYIDFKDELEIIETYIKLENKRFDDQFELITNVDPVLLKTNPKIPSMIIQPHIENAILHGLGQKNKNILKLTFDKNNNHIICTIEDNGIGRSNPKKNNSKKTSHLSISSGNTTERIKLLRKIGYKDTSLHIEDLLNTDQKPMGTKVIINLPIIENI